MKTDFTMTEHLVIIKTNLFKPFGLKEDYIGRGRSKHLLS